MISRSLRSTDQALMGYRVYSDGLLCQPVAGGPSRSRIPRFAMLFDIEGL
jgi:hypothetical protein